jgi:hypothetical protein
LFIGLFIDESGRWRYTESAQRLGRFQLLCRLSRTRSTGSFRLSVFLSVSPTCCVIGRPSIPPEQLLRALSIQSLYTVRSERLLMEEMDCSVLYR